jgi:hypothetical protein
MGAWSLHVSLGITLRGSGPYLAHHQSPNIPSPASHVLTGTVLYCTSPPAISKKLLLLHLFLVPSCASHCQHISHRLYT